MTSPLAAMTITLACFLTTLHDRTARDCPMTFSAPCEYMERFITSSASRVFSLGITLLRIARTSWLVPDTRGRLEGDAIQTLGAWP